MSKFIYTIILLFCLSITSCVEKTEYGYCIGVLDEETPELRYKVSTNNVVVGALFAETILVPAVVIFTNIKCPIGRK